MRGKDKREGWTPGKEMKKLGPIAFHPVGGQETQYIIVGCLHNLLHECIVGKYGNKCLFQVRKVSLHRDIVSPRDQVVVPELDMG